MKDILFATSFSPEYSTYIGGNPIEILKAIHQDLGINDIRLGLRWNNVEKEKGKVSLKEYDRYIKYCIEKKCKICLNVGPIKVMRWPEEHIPEWIDTEGISIVQKDSELAKYALEYFNKVLILLKKEYGDGLYGNEKVSFQIENESFNRFGHRRIIMSDEYMVDVATMLNEYFPKNSLMLNSSARNDLRKVIGVFERFVDEKIYDWRRLMIGINFYFRLPNIFPFSSRMNPLIFSRPFSMSLSELKELQKEKCFGIEITEAQFEPWGFQKTPGNMYEELEYVIQKATNIFNNEYYPKVIRLWGTEELAMKMINGKLSDEHRLIVEKIASVNSTVA